MVFGKSKLELQVGIFVFIGLIVLVGFVLMIGNFRTWGSAYNINVVFNFVNGIKIGAPVRYAGVDVGEVKAIEFKDELSVDSKPEIKIDCLLTRHVAIPQDSTVWVNTLGLLGEKYIEIIPGTDYANCLMPNQQIRGRDPIAMHEIGEIAKRIAREIELTLYEVRQGHGTVGQLMTNDSIYKEVEALVADIRRHPWKLFWKSKEKPEKK